MYSKCGKICHIVPHLQILFFPWDGPGGIQNIQGHMHQVRNQIHVTLRSPSSTFTRKAFVLSKPQK